MAKTKVVVFDLASVGGPVYVGRDRGQRAREKFGLDAFDRQGESATVQIPENVYSLNSSFFLGLFGPSIKALGSRDAFMAKYQFRAPPEIMETIESCVSRALYEKRMLLDRNDT